LLAHGGIFIDTFRGNVGRLVMELRGTQYGMASELFMEIGDIPCMSMAHCEFHGIPWRFDFGYGGRKSWAGFVARDILHGNKGDFLTHLFETKLASGHLLPDDV
jgi:hypothetical protein